MKGYQSRKCIEGTWLLHTLAMIGSMSSMVAIGILLAHYNNQPVLAWNGVTLNAIISVFSAISKAMLAFTLSECLGQAKWIWFSWQQRPLNALDSIDEASRGPLGSLKLLTQPAARSFISMGAIIVIFSAVIDPFIQLSVGKKEGVKFKNDLSAQIPYAKRYSKGSFTIIEATVVDSPDGNNYTGTETDADFGMKSAVFYGLSQPSSVISQQTQYSCPSGNCTWDAFESLAVCSACNNLTNQIEEKNLSMTSPLISYLDTTNPGMEVEQELTEYSLPNGLTGDSSMLMTAYGTGNETESISFSSYDTLIWSMTIMNFTQNKETTPTARPSVSAIEYGLWYCVNNYKSAVKGGNLTETVEPAASERDSGSWQPLRGSQGWIGGNATPPDTINYGVDSASVGRTDLRLGEGFNLSQAAVYSISDLMNSTFATHLYQGINAYVLRSADTEYIPTAMQSLYNSRNLEGTFATLAQSMTNNIRQNDDNNTVASGKLGENVVLIQARGWFLALPVILVVGGAAFLAIVLYYTHKSKIAVWGTNVLPIVALGEKLRPVFDDIDMSACQMEKDAKRSLVQFPAPMQRQALGRVGTNRQYGDYEMLTPLRTSVKQPPSTGRVSVISDDALSVEER